MTGFDTVCVIDWSAGNDTGPRPRKDAIWAGLVRGGAEAEPVYLRNRSLAGRWLEGLIEAECAAGRRLMVGFDFPFGYPEGFCAAIVGPGSPLDLWDFYADNLADEPRANTRFQLAGALNARFPGVGPFWFNGLKVDVPHLPRTKAERDGRHGQRERRTTEARANGAFTCWQMGGAGAVGGQAMTGMAMLSRLRARFGADVRVWPFEEPGGPVVFAEIWPSLLAGAVRAEGDPIKDRAQVRLLARALSRLSPGELSAMMSVEAPVEGWILGVGQEETLKGALCPA